MAKPVITKITTDSGQSASDFITNDQTLVFEGTANAGQLVEIFLNGDSIGTATANGSGVWTFDYTGTTLGAGTYNVQATGGGLSDPLNVTVDIAAPSEAVATVAFSADTGTSGSDFITNTAAQTISGTLDANLAAGDVVKVSLDNGASWQTAAATVGANTFSLSGVTLTGSNTLIARVEDTAGNFSGQLTQTYVLDQSGPHVAVNIVDGSLSDPHNASNVTFTFDEAPNGTFTSGGISVSGGTLGVLVLDSPTQFHATFTADDNVETTGSVSVTGGSYTDTAGNSGAAGSDTVLIDTKNPTVVSVDLSDNALKIGDTSTVTITFSEAVTNFDNSDVTIEHGTLSTLGSTDGVTWTGTLTPDSNVEDATNQVTVAATYTDVAGNAGSAGASGNYAIDTKAPTVIVDIAAASLNGANGSSNVTFTFSEPVSDFTNGDLSAVGGTLATLQQDDTTHYHATFTANPNTDAIGSVTVAANSYFDAAGNAGATGSDTVAIDNIADVAPAATLVVGPSTSADKYVVDIAHLVSFTVIGLDADATGVVTFTDGTHTQTVNVDPNHTSYTADLSALTGGLITSSLHITDNDSNTADVSGNSVYSTIQSAINAASAGQTIGVAAGTYAENLAVNKAVTLLGANHGVAGVDHSGGESIIAGQASVTAGATIDGFKVLNGSNNSTQFIGISVHGSNAVTIENNVFFSNGVNGSAEDRAINLDTTATGHVTISDNFITGAATGKFGGSASWHRGIWSDGATSELNVTGNTFQYVRSGINLDGYNDATTNVSSNTFETDGTGIAIGTPTGSSVAGIHDNTFSDVDNSFNLRNVTTAETFNLTTTNNTSTSGPMYVLGTAGGDTLTGTSGDDILDARDITGGAGFTDTVSNALIGLGGNDTLIGSLGDDSLTGGAGNDTLIGSGGTDTANYSTTLSVANFSYDTGTNTWTVDTHGSEGADNLSGIEKVTDGTHRFLLVDAHGAYATIQAAINAAAPGDTILIAPGTYSGFVDVTKAVNILGVNNAGIPANGGTRGAESVLTGGVRILHDGVTLDGLTIAGTFDSQGLNGTDLDNGILVTANDATIQNSILDGSGLGDVRPLSTTGGISGLNVNHNQINNWEEGAYTVEGAAGTIDHNAFTNNGNGVITESDGMHLVDVSNNTFSGSVGPDVVVPSYGSEAIAAFVHDNSYSPTLARPVSVYLIADGETVTGSNTPTTYHAEYLTGSAHADGGTGGDTISYSDNSAPVMIDLTAGTASTALNALGGAGSVTFTSIENAIGGSGADTLTGNGVSSSLDGQHGIDTAVYAGFTSANISIVGGHWTITGAHGTDTLSNVEKVSDGNGHTFLLVGDGGFASIQAAVDAAHSGDTILIGAGPYQEQVVVNGLDGLTIEGVGAVTLNATSTLHQTATSPTNGRSVDAVLTVLGSDDVTIHNLTVDGLHNGASFAPGQSNPTFVGISYINSGGMIDHVTVTGVREADAGFGLQRNVGIYVSNSDPSPANPVPTTTEVTNHVLNKIVVSSSTINDFQKGGIVVVNAEVNIHDNTVSGVGATSLTAQNGIQVSGSTGSIVDNDVSGIGYIPATFSATSILTFDNRSLAITGNVIHAATHNGQPVSTEGIDVSDSSDGTVTGNQIHDAAFAIVGLSEALSAADLSGTFTVGNNTIDGVPADGSGVYFDTTPSASTSPMDIEGSDSADLISGADGDDTLKGFGGDDEIDGHGGIDTAHYTGNLVPGSGPAHTDFAVVSGHWVVSTSLSEGASNEGTDTLSSVEVVQDGSGHTFRLVGADSGYATTQQAFAASQPGDIIIDGSADFDGNLTLSLSDTLISASEASHVSFVIAGLDPDASGTVTFTDSQGNVATSSLITGNGTYSADLHNLVDGAVASVFSVTDSAGYTTSANGTAITLDTTPPTVTVTSDDNEVNASETTTIHFNFSEAVTGFDPSSADVSVTGGSLSNFQSSDAAHWTATFTPAATTETAHAQVSVVAASYTDSAGNPGGTGTTGDFIVDTIAPTITINTPIAGDNKLNLAEANNGFTISGTTTDVENGQHVTVQINSAGPHTYDAVVTNNAWSVDVTDGTSLPDGNHTVTAQVSDHAGNPSYVASEPLLVDETPPQLSGTVVILTDNGSGGTELDLQGNTDASVIDVSDANGTLGSPTADGSGWSDTVSTLANGSHHVTVTVTDAALNTTSTSFDVSGIGSADVTLDLSTYVMPDGTIVDTSGLPGHPNVTLFGSAGSDTILTGDGDDVIDGGIGGADQVIAGDGADQITTHGNGSQVDAGAGNDIVTDYITGNAIDTVVGGDGDDTITFVRDVAHNGGSAEFSGRYDPAAVPSHRDYSLEHTLTDTWVVTALTGTDGTDTVTGADTLLFDGGPATGSLNTADLIGLLGAATGSVDENSPSGTLVGITAHATGHNVTYALSNNDGGRFAIDSSTGDISAGAHNIDRELDGASRQVTVVATADDGSFTRHTYTINIGDVNDNAPVFTSGTTGSEAENTAPTNVVYDANATDADATPANSTITFSLTGADATLFSIDGSSGEVRFLNSPDYENPADADHDKNYQVIVHANDGVHDITQDVTISVTDRNDNAPVITTATTQSVVENTTLVANLTSTDADTVGTNPATFTITGGDDAAAFTIVTVGGVQQLQFIAAPDFEAHASFAGSNSYQVQVTADDGLNTTPELITVNVTDANDNAPVITTAAAQSVVENTTFVANLTSTDADTVGTNPATFSITGGDDAAAFTIVTVGGVQKLQFIAAPDFEAHASHAGTNSYQVQVTADDGLNTTPELITVNVTDANDNTPVITTAAAQSVVENTTFVANLTSTDADTVGTNPATFSITGGNDAAAFTIVTVGGVQQLQFVTAPDFEAHASFAGSNSYQVQVTANDGANTTPELITVNVTDANDNAPLITTATTQSVVENTTVVANLTSTDADTVGTNPATFSITGGDDAAAFTIVTVGGVQQLQFVSAPDFEAHASFAGTNSYQVQVTASDGLNTTPELITVNVTDANDNAPVITTAATQSVVENTTLVANLTSSDADTIGTNPATFSITGGDDAAAFTIVTVGGVQQLQFIAAPDFEAHASHAGSNSYQVQVTASDGVNATPELITVNVTDANDNAPQITTAATQSVVENTTFVANLTSTDADSVGTSPATFSISGGDDATAFTIVTVGGVQQLQFLAAPDFEAHASHAGSNSYQVQVTASDGVNATPELITVNVTDANDSAPVITTAATQSVVENTTFVVNLTSTDADTVGTSPATFSITGGDDAAAFTIATIGGVQQLQFLAAPDFEAHASHAGSNSYQVQVTASDGLNTTPELITVNVTDANDNAPVIITAATQPVVENTTVVANLTSTDADTIGTNPATFSITGGDDAAAFQIVTVGGVQQLQFASAPDFEAHASHAGSNAYQVQVTANDGLNTTPELITVNVTDVNEAPSVTAGQSLTPAENVQLAGNVVATDQDSLASGFHSIVYSLDAHASDNDLFTIDASTGALNFVSPAGSDGADPLGTHGPDYVVDVRVSDGSTPSLTTHQTVAVHAQTIGAIINNGTTGNDTEYGTVSGDTLSGNAGNDTIYGGAGGDNIDGGSGNDTLYGGVGNDTINGGAGNDKIYGGTGADMLTGGSGADQFVFNNPNEGTDTITDFLSANSVLADKITLDKAGFGIGAGVSSTDLFTNGNLSFHDGGLWWTADPINAPGTTTELAIVQHITHMSGTDILLV